MSKRRKLWIAAFLGVTLLAIGMEIGAALVDSDDMPTWTVLIVDHISWEVFAFAWGGFFVWTGAHFFPRFWRKHKADKEIE